MFSRAITLLCLGYRLHVFAVSNQRKCAAGSCAKHVEPMLIQIGHLPEKHLAEEDLHDGSFAEGFCCFWASNSADICGSCEPNRVASAGTWCAESKARCEGCGGTATWCSGGGSSQTTTDTVATTSMTSTTTTSTTTALTTTASTTTTTSSTSSTQNGESCARAFQQCGGQNWNGPTCCADADWICDRVNQWHSQCEPSSTGATTTTTSGATTTTTSSATVSSTTTTVDSTTSAGSSAGWTQGTYTTGYWDCCKPSCSWPDKGKVISPTLSCDVNSGNKLSDPNVKSVCDGGSAASCSDNKPWAVNSTLSLGFAAAAVGGGHGLTGDDNCGQCYELKFIDRRHSSGNWGGSHPDIVDKTMIVQVTNIGYDVSGEHSFDLQIPGAGQGAFDSGCTSQFQGYATGDFDCDNNYGGCFEKSGCNRLPSALQDGCEWRYDWYKWYMGDGQTNNPYVDFRRVKCPAQLTDISGSSPEDDDQYPEINV